MTGSKLSRQLTEKKQIEELILVKCQVSSFKSQVFAMLKAKKNSPVVREVKIYGGSSILKQRLKDASSNLLNSVPFPLHTQPRILEVSKVHKKLK